MGLETPKSASFSITLPQTAVNMLHAHRCHLSLLALLSMAGVGSWRARALVMVCVLFFESSITEQVKAYNSVDCTSNHTCTMSYSGSPISAVEQFGTLLAELSSCVSRPLLTITRLEGAKACTEMQTKLLSCSINLTACCLSIAGLVV